MSKTFYKGGRFPLLQWTIFLVGAPITSLCVIFFINLVARVFLAEANFISMKPFDLMLYVSVISCILYIFNWVVLGGYFDNYTHFFSAQKSVNILDFEDFELNKYEVKVKNVFIDACSKLKAKNVELRLVDGAKMTKYRSENDFRIECVAPPFFTSNPRVIFVDRKLIIGACENYCESYLLASVVDGVAWSKTEIISAKRVAELCLPLMFIFGVIGDVLKTDKDEINSGGMGYAIAFLAVTVLALLLGVSGAVMYCTYFAFYLLTDRWRRTKAEEYASLLDADYLGKAKSCLRDESRRLSLDVYSKLYTSFPSTWSTETEGINSTTPSYNFVDASRLTADQKVVNESEIFKFDAAGQKIVGTGRASNKTIALRTTRRLFNLIFLGIMITSAVVITSNI